MAFLIKVMALVSLFCPKLMIIILPSCVGGGAGVTGRNVLVLQQRRYAQQNIVALALLALCYLLHHCGISIALRLFHNLKKENSLEIRGSLNPN